VGIPDNCYTTGVVALVAVAVEELPPVTPLEFLGAKSSVKTTGRITRNDRYYREQEAPKMSENILF